MTDPLWFPAVTAAPATVVVVEDDEYVRRALERFLRAHGYAVRAFESAEAWLASILPAKCAIVDINLPGMSGFELDEQLRVNGHRITTVFITAHDEPRACGPLPPRRLILQKPLDERRLLDAIERAVRRD